MVEVKTFINSEPIISFSLPFHDWCLLQESQLWERLESFLEACQGADKRVDQREKIFVSERIINISELETLLSAARLNYEILLSELQVETQPERIQELSCAVRDALEKAEDFEFCLEKRKCVFKGTSENPTSGGNPISADNQV